MSAANEEDERVEILREALREARKSLVWHTNDYHADTPGAISAIDKVLALTDSNTWSTRSDGKRKK